MKIRDIFTEQKPGDDYTVGGGISSADPLSVGGRDVSGRLTPMQIDIGLGGTSRGSGVRGKTPATAVLRGRETPAQARSREAGERTAAAPAATPKTKYTRDTDLPIVGKGEPVQAPAATPAASAAPTTKPGLRDRYNQWKYKETDPIKIEKIKQEKYATAQSKAQADIAKAQAKQIKAATPMSLGAKAGILGGAAAAGTAADYLTTPADQEFKPSLSGTFIKGPARAIMGPDPRSNSDADTSTDANGLDQGEEIVEPSPNQSEPPSGEAGKPRASSSSAIEPETEPETAAADKIKSRGDDLWKESRLKEEVNNKGFYVNYGERAKVGGSRNWRNNNPGNIEYGKFAKEMGAIGSDGRFAIFPDSKTGYEAAHKLLTDPQRGYHGKTIAQNIQRWAPQSENNTTAYIKSLQKAGFDPNTKYSDLSPEQKKQFLNTINNIEGGRPGFVVPTGKIQQQLNLTGRLGKSQQAALPTKKEPIATAPEKEPVANKPATPVPTKGSKIADYIKSTLGVAPAVTPTDKPVTAPSTPTSAPAATPTTTAKPSKDVKAEPSGQAAKPQQSTTKDTTKNTTKDTTTPSIEKDKKPAQAEKPKEVKPSDSSQEFKFDPIAFKKVEPATDIVSANPQIKGVIGTSNSFDKAPNKDWTKEIDKNALSVQESKQIVIDKYNKELKEILKLAGRK